MLNKQERINELRAEIAEIEETCDLFDGYRRLLKSSRFGRDSSFDEDIVSLIKKWKGKPQEVFVRHMVDSLILFNHNRNQLEDVNTSDKLGKTEVWEAIQLQLNS